MKTNIGIWEIDREARKPVQLPPTNQLTEKILEDILAVNPGMLMRRLTLVGRQVQIETGRIDLLGIDDKGRLTVFELKSERLTRNDVAQVLHYGSYLEGLSESKLATHIAKESGKNGIDEITDFVAWYASRWNNDALKPIQMMLVGLGADANARRMVDYLAEQGIDIGITAFHAYARGDGLLLARQVQTSNDSASVSRSRVSKQKADKQEVDRKVKEYEVANLWRDATKELDYSVQSYYTKSGITYCQRTIILPDNAHIRASHFITIEEHGKVRITFSPGTVHLCYEDFEQLKEAIRFEKASPHPAPATQRVQNQWFCNLDEESWQNHKERLIEFVQTMGKAFANEYRRSMSEEMEENEAS